MKLFNRASTSTAPHPTAPASKLDVACQRVRASESIDGVIEALRECGRAIVGADGLTIIRREGDEVVYVTEDAISPLWSGQRFSIRVCVSGMAIQARAPIVIPDIMQDRRVPLNAYIATFVRSMAVVPIGHGEPGMAIGAYWRHAQPIAQLAVERLTALAHAAADALDRIEGTADPGRQVA